MKKSAVLLTMLITAACGELDGKTIAKWKGASDSAKNKFAIAHFADHADYVKNCIDKISAMPNTDAVKISDAGNICMTGMKLREHNMTTAKSAKNAKK